MNYKSIIQCGFVVICPKPNLGHLKTTLASIKGNYAAYPVVTVIPEEIDELDLGKSIGTVVKAKGSPVAQINAGIAKSTCKEWVFIIQAGTWVRNMIDIKFSHFVESERDILFPILQKKIRFIDADWNGTLLHKKAVNELGPFPDNNPENLCKLIWTIEAINRGYNFKGIVGACLR